MTKTYEAEVRIPGGVDPTTWLTIRKLDTPIGVRWCVFAPYQGCIANAKTLDSVRASVRAFGEVLSFKVRP